MSASLVELAEDWLAAKRIGARSDDPGHADRARRSDLARWGQVIALVTGRREAVDPSTLDLAADLAPVGLADLADPDVLLRALAALSTRYEPATRARMLSTMRVFCGWLVRRGHLDADPTDADELTVRRVTGRRLPKAFTADEVSALLAAADDPPPRARTAWPSRDRAALALLASCGLRVSEACSLEVADLDTSGEHPLLRVTRGAKGGKARNIPVPAHTLELVAAYRSDRAERAADGPPGLGSGPRAALLVRLDGSPLNSQFVDRIIRRCAEQAGIRVPDGAAAHALRHHFGVQLTLRGVPVTALQQLMGHADPRTTSIYTAMAEAELAGILLDAGWL